MKGPVKTVVHEDGLNLAMHVEDIKDEDCEPVKKGSLMDKK